MKTGKLRFKESIKNILSFILIINVLIIIPIEVLSCNVICYIFIIVKSVVFYTLIEKTNILD